MNKPIKPLAPHNTILYCSLFIDKLSARDGSRLSDVSNKGNSKILNFNTNKLIVLYFLSKYVILITFQINQFQICQYHFPRKTEKLRNSAVQRNVSLYAAV